MLVFWWGVDCRLVEEEGAWVEFTNRHGQTPLHSACARGHLAVARWLAETHCSWLVDRADNTGRTPFAAALYGGHMRVAQWLAANWPVDVAKPDKRGETPFYAAVSGGALEASRVKPLILGSRG